MAEQTVDARPWWRKKTNWGIGLYLVGETLQKIPIKNSWVDVAGFAMSSLGAALAGYGIGDRVAKMKKGPE